MTSLPRSRLPYRLVESLQRTYQRRPRALLFLGISYAIWASVSLRWVLEFIEQEHPQTLLVSAILLLFGLLMGLEPLMTGGSGWRGHLYLAVQLGLVVTALLLYYELDFFALLLLPLTGQATYLFPRRTAAAWVGVFLLATFLGQIHQFGWPEGLSFIFLYVAGILFVAAFSLSTLQAEASRQRSEALLAELQEAHRQLQAYAGQAEELVVAQERNRLARELHDSVAQTLYGLTLQSEAAERKLAAGQVDQVSDYLRQFRASAQQTLQETRLLIFELRPPILEEVGLAAALRARLQAVEGRSGLACRLNLQEGITLPARVEVGLYRIALEGLNNIMKHAQATWVSLSLAQDGQRVRLELADDGIGFDPAQAAARGGYGLQNMHERAEQIGATIRLDSAPGEGATLTVEATL